MKTFTWAVALLLAFGLARAAEVVSTAAGDQVFQWMAQASYTTPSGRTCNATAYLWIPPACERVRGLLVAGRNVPEHGLVGHSAIRAACADSDLAILWCAPSFLMVDVNDGRAHGEFLQRLLDPLAAASGYAEIRTAPWLPIGESMHLLMVTRLLNAFPERCIAGIQLKNGRLDLHATGVPSLIALGTCDEWDQQRKDLTAQWQDVSFFDRHRKRRADQADWPASLLIEGGSGHFECTEAMTAYVAQYIRSAVRARLAPAGGLRPVELATGYVTGFPLPGHEPVPPVRYTEASTDAQSLPWFFDRDLAAAAYAMADIDWTRKTQVTWFADPHDGKPLAPGPRGIVQPIPYTTEADGVTFQLAATFLERMPDGFVHAGEVLGHAAGTPEIDWICGHVAPLGGNRFRIALDRTWPESPTFLRAWHPGDATYRPSTQPAELHVKANKNGRPQTIVFAPIPDQPAGGGSLKLAATSDSGLPVSFFVRAGPAEVHGNRLVLTPIPARSALPVAVTVVAWQWGRTAEPAIQTAPLVERTFRIGTAKPGSTAARTAGW